MMAEAQSAASRRCLVCDATETAASGQPIWPPRWRCHACGHVVESFDGFPLFAPALVDTTTGMDPVWLDRLLAVEETHFWFVARSALICGLVAKYFPQARHFMEIGCGNGGVLRNIAALRAWERLAGSELHPSGLAAARQRLPRNVELAQMDARDIPARGMFDLTGAFDVIEHIAEDETVLRSLRDATVTGGGTIIAVPQHPWLWSRADDRAFHQRRYRRGELERKLRAAGFQPLFSSSFTALLLPAMVAARFTQRDTNAEDDFAREFHLDPRINRALLALTRMETALTLRGLRWPLGGSRIVVARAV